MTKKVLILNSFIKNYTGSEIVTFDVAKAFRSMGYIVSVAGFDIGEPLISEFKKNGLSVENIYNLIDYSYYDIILAHHFITLEYCLLNKNISGNKIIFSSLSPFTSLESPPIVLNRVSLFLANSLETKKKLETMGINKKNILLFPNPVSSDFFKNSKVFTDNNIKKIIIISNHIPTEIIQSVDILKSNKFEVELFGQGFKQELITAERLLKYDAAITIGKSVQYCLSLGIPVYCYDMFGGPGWINLKNIKQAEKFNFSGRCTEKRKNSLSIFEDLDNYKINSIELERIRKYAAENYDIKKLINNIISLEHKKNILSLRTLYKIILRQREFYQEQLFGVDFSQLFFADENESFSEDYSIRKKIIPDGLNEVVFVPPRNKNRFRFDPANRSVLISNLSIKIFYKTHESEVVYDYTTYNLIITDNDKSLYSLSNDPQVYFESNSGKQIDKITISFNLEFSQKLDEKISNFIREKEGLVNKQSALLERLSSQEVEINSLYTETYKLKNKISDINTECQYLKSCIEEKDGSIEYSSKKIELLKLENEKKETSLKKMFEEFNDLNFIYKNEKERLENIIEKSNCDLMIRENIIFDLKIELKNKAVELENIKCSKGYKVLQKIKPFFSRSKTDYELLMKSKLFNSEYYLNINDDVKQAKLDPISHFLEFGWREGRQPSRHFDISFYLIEHNDVKESGQNPLVHYIKYGKKEKRKIKSVEKSEGAISLYFKVFKLLKTNPLLLKKFILMVKNQGLSRALLKVKNKVSSLNVIENLKEEIVDLDKLLKNLSADNLDKLNKFYSENKLKKTIDIIIPVYNGYEFLDNLFDSLRRNTSLPYRLLIANDKSPDERVKPFIDNFILQNPNLDILFLDNQENLGFLKTVNLLASYAKNHIVILNTDTEVPHLWLERLMYPILSNSKIASTTPFTNSGTICSFPNYLVDNKEIYENLSLEEVDNLFKLVDVEQTMLSVPTGVGFCMGMNFDVIQKIGMFDEIYGKGYAEENDWCQRAIQAGYTNIHITNLFVYHKHGGSFLSEDKIKYINEHYQLLLNKFPTYDAQIQNTVKENSLNGLRALIKALLDFNFICSKTILMFDHDLGGGANSYRKQEIKRQTENGFGVILLHYNINYNTYNLSFYAKKDKQTFLIESEESILNLLKFIRVDEVFLNGLVSYPKVLDTLKFTIKVKSMMNAKIIFPVHDYFCISPNYTLLDDNNKYSGVPMDLEEHSKFLKTTKHEFKLFCQENDAKVWRQEWGNFLNECEAILCFSHSSEKIMLTAYPNLKDKLVYIPHDISGTFSNIYIEKKDKKGKVIGVLGNINLAKGRDIIKEIISYVEENKLNVKVVLIGNIDAEIKSNHFVKTGSYKKEDIPNLIKEHQIDEFLIPSVWPETFSYTTDEIMQLGYPLSVFDVGAPAERVKLYNKGRILQFGHYLENLCM